VVFIALILFQKRLIAPIIARALLFTPPGAIPSGQPSGAAVLLLSSVSFQLLAAMSISQFLAALGRRIDAAEGPRGFRGSAQDLRRLPWRSAARLPRGNGPAAPRDRCW